MTYTQNVTNYSCAGDAKNPTSIVIINGVAEFSIYESCMATVGVYDPATGSTTYYGLDPQLDIKVVIDDVGAISVTTNSSTWDPYSHTYTPLDTRAFSGTCVNTSTCSVAGVDSLNLSR
jgi:hypothetical protein